MASSIRLGSAVQAMQRIAGASNLIRELMGPFCSTLATALLERGFDLGQDVLPAVMHALAIGPGPAMPSQGEEDLYSPKPLLKVQGADGGKEHV
jgi:hypothetical protein